jgi:uncharacterized membrane protein YgdD (TMEM256/DUF423 family)
VKTNKYLKIAAISMVIAIALGAMGAHYLKENLELPADKLDSWKTGVLYQVIHSLSIFIVILLATRFKIDKVGAVINLFFIGILLFSGSIYLLTLNYIWQIDALRFLGPITPIGGLLFITGWVLLFFRLKKIT